MTFEIIPVFILFMAGMIIATLGSMTGLGGGFLCVPFLIIAWGMGRDDAVLVSLTMILANSISSSISYLRRRMVDLAVGFMLAVSALPGLYVGFWLLKNMDAAEFDLLFAILLVTVTTYILITRSKKKIPSGKKSRDGRFDGDRGGKERRLVPHLSLPISFIAGAASSAFGIGGGAVLMPLQVGLLKMDVKKAIATSMFLLMMITGFRVVVISRGGFDPFIALPLAVGALIGAQAGSLVVRKVKGKYLLYVLSAFLFVIAIYMAAGSIPELIGS